MAGLLQDILIDGATGQVTSWGNSSFMQSYLGEHQIMIIKEMDENYQPPDINSIEGMIGGITNLIVNNSPLGAMKSLTSEASHATYMHSEAIKHMDERGVQGFESDSITIGGETFRIHADASGLAYGQKADVIIQGSASDLTHEQKKDLNNFRRDVESRAAEEMNGYTTPEGSAIYKENLESYVKNNLGAEYAAKQQSASLQQSSLELNGPLTTGGGDAGYIQAASADGLNVTAGAMEVAKVATPANVTHAPQALTA